MFISIPTKQKGLMESIKLVKKIFNNDDWVMNVIGWDKNMFNKIYQDEQNIDAKTLKKIKFLGRVNDDHKFELLLKSDLFILLSYKEAQPLSVIEAGMFKCGIILSEIEMLLELKNFKVFYLITKINKIKNFKRNKEFKFDKNI